MARGIEVKVTANTKAARNALQDLDAEVQKMQKKAAARNKQQEKDGSGLGGLGGSISGSLGLEKYIAQLEKIPIAGKAARGALEGVKGVISGLNAGLLAGVAAVKGFYDGMADWVKIGQKASDAGNKINVSLSTLAKNLGSNVSTDGLTQDLQWLAAEGVGNLDQLTSAARTLMVAFEGNQGIVKSLLPVFDDMAAATSLTADQLAQMTARVGAAGKIETEVLNMLRDRGIPVYKMLGEVMGVSGDEALELARNGKAGLGEWLDMVQKMHESFKGLSAELSSNTLEGAKATYDAAKSLAFKGAADAASAQEMARLNTKSAQLKIDAFDMELQTQLLAAGSVVGKVQGVIADVGELWEDKWALASKALAGAISLFSDMGEQIGQNLVAAAADFRQIPNFAGASSKAIGEYLAKASNLYKQMEGTLNAGTDMEEKTANKFKAAMERIKKNIELAEEASNEALKAETKAAAEKKAAEEAAAAAAKEKEEADKAAAKQAEKERIEREKNEAAIKKERIERLKAIEEYSKTIEKEAAREQADAAVDAGDVDALEKAADAMAQAAGALNMTDAELMLEQLVEKIKNAPETVTNQDLETHRELAALLDEVQKLNEAAVKQRAENAERAAKEAENREKDRKELVDALADSLEEAQKEAREKAENQKEALDPEDISTAAELYQQELLDSGLSIREARKLFEQWVQQQMEAAQDNLINGFNYTDASGHTERIAADPENLKAMRELVKETHSGTLAEKKAAREQITTMQEANKLAKEQIKILGKLKFEAKAL
ncbi:MAG: hypothetical protein IKY91_03915 [Akkermansia sp.]|nr:hypothetical protein [Akkermansia sp.]